MSRPRFIDQNDILNAAEAVVVRDGAARLTLDAVAVEAGISKASVIYDFKTKQALIKAVIERRVQEDLDHIEVEIERLGPVDDARVRGRIVAAGAEISEETNAVAVSLCSALAQDAEMRALLQQSTKEELEAIERGSSDPRRAIVAFLAVEGLRSFEFLGIHTWPEPKRTQVLRDIERLLDIEFTNPPSK